jgi:hypothetical protein
MLVLAEAQRNADPDYVANSTGFWLDRWQGKRSVNRGTRRTPCQATPTSPTIETSSSVVNSDFSL